MVDLTPGTALLAALQGQFNAARQGQGQGTNALIPGLAGQGTDSGSVVGGLGGGGISAGGVPGTATSGQSIANSLIGGGGAGGDPLAQQVLGSARSFNQNEPGERGDLGAGVTGGDLGMLRMLLGLGPLAMPAILGQLVFNDATDPGLGTNSISSVNRESGNTAFSTNTGTGLTTPTVNVGSLGISNRDRDNFGPGGPGASPNRGTVSNAGR